MRARLGKSLVLAGVACGEGDEEENHVSNAAGLGGHLSFWEGGTCGAASAQCEISEGFHASVGCTYRIQALHRLALLGRVRRRLWPCAACALCCMIM